MKLYVSIALGLMVGLSGAQSKKKQDIEAIKSMGGCYEVTFNFAETFNHSKDSTYHGSKTKTDKAIEWVQVVDDEKDKISFQHLLVVGPKERPMIVKHWRQDWLYQNTELYEFNHDNKWTFTSLPKSEVKGQWTQKVFQVDDSPRYEGSASWVHVDGKSYWENTTTAPLPRREYTKRSDYNVTLRGNRHEITPEGWVHDQDNAKVIREDGKEDVVLAYEKGYNTYVKVDASKCQPAIDWWKKNAVKWESVRAKWHNVYSRNTNLELKSKVDNKVLYKHLFSDDANTPEKIDEIIEKFITK